MNATVRVLHGDCLDVLATLPDASVDAVVTDPPYGLGFMGKAWDDLPPGVEWATECLRVLKPGGHLLAFGGTRTSHRLACAVEDAGFEIRDSIAWLYGSGFPKSLDVSKAIDRQRHDGGDKLLVTSWLAEVAERNGVTRAEVDARMGTSDMAGWWLSRLRHRCAIPTLDQVPRLLDVLGVAADDVPDEIRALLIDLNGMKGQPGPAWFRREVTGERFRAATGRAEQGSGGYAFGEGFTETAPATDDARTWQGWGTALKPAHEPVVVARKPLTGTVAANVLAHGTGALNIEATRTNSRSTGPGTTPKSSVDGQRGSMAGRPMDRTDYDGSKGRWPANVVLDETQAAALDAQSGTLTSGANPTRRGAEAMGKAYGGFAGQDDAQPKRGIDTGGASRFFYVAKAPKKERPKVDGVAHPTVKPVTLMRWLVRLVTPPGGVVLDPFAGSGTTGEACLLEGFDCVLIERETEYLPLIEARLQRAAPPTAVDRRTPVNEYVDVPMFDVEPGRVVTPKRPRVSGRPKWSRLKRVSPVKCDDCSLVLALAEGAAPPARIAHFRRAAPDRTDLLLCAAHAQTRRDEDGLEPLEVSNA